MTVIPHSYSQICMETAPPNPVVEALSAPSNDRIDTFFTTLRREQASFLDAIGNARAALGDGSGQLAHVAAIHCNLTRQFFDAQRAILARRADVDVEVTRVLAATRGAAQLEGNELGQLIDDAFEPGAPDSAAAERQLASLLDEWWVAENREGLAVINDANARVAVRLHVAGLDIKSEHVAVVAPKVAPNVRPAESALPSHVLSSIESVRVDDLDALLETLSRQLAQGDAAAVVEQPADSMTPLLGEMIIRLGGLALPEPKPAPVTDNRSFWSDRSTRSASGKRGGLRAALVHAVLPITAVTSGLVLVMAWIG